MQFRYQISLPRPVWSSFCNKLSRIDSDVRQRIDQFFSTTSRDICIQHGNGEMTVSVHDGIDEAKLIAILNSALSPVPTSESSPSAEQWFSGQATFSFQAEQIWIPFSKMNNATSVMLTPSHQEAGKEFQAMSSAPSADAA